MRHLRQTKRPRWTCCSPSSKKDLGRGRYTTWLPKETLKTAQTTEGLLFWLSQGKCPTESFWTGWKMRSTLSWETSKLAFARTDHKLTKSSRVSGTLPFTSILLILRKRSTLWTGILFGHLQRDSHGTAQRSFSTWGRESALPSAILACAWLDYEIIHSTGKKWNPVDTLAAAWQSQLCGRPGTTNPHASTNAGEDQQGGSFLWPNWP